MLSKVNCWAWKLITMQYYKKNRTCFSKANNIGTKLRKRNSGPNKRQWVPPPPVWNKWNTDAPRIDSIKSTTISFVCKDNRGSVFSSWTSQPGTVRFWVRGLWLLGNYQDSHWNESLRFKTNFLKIIGWDLANDVTKCKWLQWILFMRMPRVFNLIFYV